MLLFLKASKLTVYPSNSRFLFNDLDLLPMLFPPSNYFSKSPLSSIKQSWMWKW